MSLSESASASVRHWPQRQVCTVYMYLEHSVHPQTNLHIFHYISITSHTTLFHQWRARSCSPCKDEYDRTSIRSFVTVCWTELVLLLCCPTHPPGVRVAAYAILARTLGEWSSPAGSRESGMSAGYIPHAMWILILCYLTSAATHSWT